MEDDKKCIFCNTSRKIKGSILSGLVIFSSICLSVLNYSTDCRIIENVGNNSAVTINDMQNASRAITIALLMSSCFLAMFEHHTQNLLKGVKEENEELKSQVSRSQMQNISVNNEPFDNLTPTVNNKNSGSNRSEYPTALDIPRMPYYE